MTTKWTHLTALDLQADGLCFTEDLLYVQLHGEFINMLLEGQGDWQGQGNLHHNNHDSNIMVVLSLKNALLPRAKTISRFIV